MVRRGSTVRVRQRACAGSRMAPGEMGSAVAGRWVRTPVIETMWKRGATLRWVTAPFDFPRARSRGVWVDAAVRSRSAWSLAQKQIRRAPIITSHGSQEADGDARNDGPLREWSCCGGSCRLSADDDRANDEHGDNGYDGDDDHDEHGDDDHDEHGGDDYPCGDHDGAADVDYNRLVTASAGDSR
jgi:hypothetical protein